MSVPEALPYDESSPASIEAYAKRLIGKTFKEAAESHYSGGRISFSKKGGLGQFLEKYYFRLTINSESRPDFEKAGVELKTSPLKRVGDSYHAKERIVLNIINYETIIDESWEESSLMMKSGLLLLIFYLFEKEKERLDYIIKIATLWGYTSEDLEIMRQDWEKIVGKIRSGKAHELSEGDTFYLGACTKGVNSKTTRPQPCSEIKAKQRAFSLKMKYVNRIIQSCDDADSVIDKKSLEKGDVEDIFISRTKKYEGKSYDQIRKMLGLPDSTAKNKFALLAARMMGSTKSKVEEFEKADVVMRTIRLKKNGVPKEDISFPYFKYTDLVEQTWDDSDFNDVLEKKFFFMVFQYDDSDSLIFKKAMFWNMSYDDRLQAKKVWEKTVKLIKRGEYDDLPKKSESNVAHVRPHGRDSRDLTPTPDGREAKKKCFWLNAQYIKKQIENG